MFSKHQFNALVEQVAVGLIDAGLTWQALRETEQCTIAVPPIDLKSLALRPNPYRPLEILLPSVSITPKAMLTLAKFYLITVPEQNVKLRTRQATVTSLLTRITLWTEETISRLRLGNAPTRPGYAPIAAAALTALAAYRSWPDGTWEAGAHKLIYRWEEDGAPYAIGVDGRNLIITCGVEETFPLMERAEKDLLVHYHRIAPLEVDTAPAHAWAWLRYHNPSGAHNNLLAACHALSLASKVGMSKPFRAVMNWETLVKATLTDVLKLSDREVSFILVNTMLAEIMTDAERQELVMESVRAQPRAEQHARLVRIIEQLLEVPPRQLRLTRNPFLRVDALREAGAHEAQAHHDHHDNVTENEGEQAHA